MGQEFRYRLVRSSACGLSQAAIKMSARAVVLSEDLTGEGSASKLTYMVGCWQDSVPRGLLAWGPQFPAGCGLKAALGSLAHALSNMAAYSIKASKRESSKTELASYIPSSQKWQPITFAIFYRLEASHWASPQSKWKGYIRGQISGGENPSKIL